MWTPLCPYTQPRQHVPSHVPQTAAVPHSLWGLLPKHLPSENSLQGDLEGTVCPQTVLLKQVTLLPPDSTLNVPCPLLSTTSSHRDMPRGICGGGSFNTKSSVPSRAARGPQKARPVSVTSGPTRWPDSSPPLGNTGEPPSRPDQKAFREPQGAPEGCRELPKEPRGRSLPVLFPQISSLCFSHVTPGHEVWVGMRTPGVEEAGSTITFLHVVRASVINGCGNQSMR